MFLRILILCLLITLGPAPLWAKPFKVFGTKLDKSTAVWGSLYTPPIASDQIGKNAKLELFIRPQFTLYRFNKKTTLIGYSLVSVIGNTDKAPYDNKVAFATGIEIQYRLSPAVKLSFGGQWKYEYEYLVATPRSGFVLTADLSLWKTWKPDWLTQRLPDGSELILSGWANYRYPASLYPSEKNNGQLQGAFKLAVSMPYKDTQLKIEPFGSLTAKADHLGRAYNNTLEPALGIEAKWPFKKGGSIALGAKSAYQVRHATGTSEQINSLYLTWYKKY